LLPQVEVEAEFEDLSAQLFEAQQKVHELQQSLTESDAKRCAQREPLMLTRDRVRVTPSCTALHISV